MRLGLVLCVPHNDLTGTSAGFVQHFLSFMLLSCPEGARASVMCAAAPDFATPDAPPPNPNPPAAGDPNPPGYVDQSCREVAPSALSRDAAVARWLWRWSAAEVDLAARWRQVHGNAHADLLDALLAF